jgi:multiple sugar transport system permease protein
MNAKTKIVCRQFIFLIIPLFVFLVVTLFPFYWILNTSLKGSREIFNIPIKYWPSHPSFENYTYLFRNLGFNTYFRNSAVVSVSTTLLVAFLSLLGGYAMSRYKFRGKSAVYVLLLVTQMLPAVVLMIPLFRTMNYLGLINNLLSLILICTCTNLPFCIFLMMGYFNAIPKGLEEAARIDGCSLLGAIFRILLPAMSPSIVATGAYAFINSWNVYVYAIAFITDKKWYTLPLALNVFQGEFGTEYGQLAAGCVISLIPVIIIFAFIQKHLSGGSTAGAVKG